MDQRMQISFLLNACEEPGSQSPLPSTGSLLDMPRNPLLTANEKKKPRHVRKRTLQCLDGCSALLALSSAPNEADPSTDGNCTSGGEDESLVATTRSSRKSRTPPCRVAGCKNFSVSRGCCVRHGGGSRCTVAGCPNRAKLNKRCFQHGGFKTCLSEGCTRKAKRYGYCWSHGGGRICEVEHCNKVSTQGGLCWAHGGGNRCKLDGCSRRSYQKYGYYCVDHAVEHHL